MKVLQIISIHQWTGPADYVVCLAEYLIKNKVKVLVGFRNFYQGVFKQHLMEKNIPFTEELKFPRGIKPIILFQDLKNLDRIIKDFKPDIIHCHNSRENILCSILKTKYNFILIRSIHNQRNLRKKFLRKFFLNQNDYLITNCQNFKEKLIKFYNIPEQKIEIIKGFVDIKKFRPIKNSDFLKNNFNIPNNRINIGMVARFQPNRGHKYLIDAFTILIKEGINNINLILVGRGEELENLKNYVKENNLTQFIFFTGYIKEELPELLNSFDIFVLLQEGSDGSCRAVLEAMSCGLPIITVYKGALRETIIEGKNGFFIESKQNIKALYYTLKKLIFNKELREKLGKNSRKIVEKNFSMENQLKKYYDFYTLNLQKKLY